MHWKIIDTGISEAEKNMTLDKELLLNLREESLPILHLYDWKGPSATYGHFAAPSDLISCKEAKTMGLQMAKRPTGGGMIFHLTDWAFSILIPANHPAYSVNTLENYAYINRLVMDVLYQFCGKGANFKLLPEESLESSRKGKNFCMAKPTCYDVMLNGKKVCGGAERRTRFGFLHQGTISLTLPNEDFLDRILLSPAIKALMQENTRSLLSENASLSEIREARKHLAELFKRRLQSSLDLCRT